MTSTRTTAKTAVRNQSGHTSDMRNTNTRNAYVSGTAARQLEIERRYRDVREQTDVRRQLEQPKKQLSHTTLKNREKARHMNLGYVLFLSAALALTGFVLIGYIRMQSNITSSVKQISKLESQLNSLKLSNDEQLSRVESSIDLEEIRRIAITELGMTYAGEGQIIEIPDDGSDYVRQYTEIHQ